MYRVLNYVPKLWMHFMCMVAEHSVSLRRVIVRLPGGIRSENADMSNEKSVRNTLAEIPRVPV